MRIDWNELIGKNCEQWIHTNAHRLQKEGKHVMYLPNGLFVYGNLCVSSVLSVARLFKIFHKLYRFSHFLLNSISNVSFVNREKHMISLFGSLASTTMSNNNNNKTNLIVTQHATNLKIQLTQFLTQHTNTTIIVISYKTSERKKNPVSVMHYSLDV